jgi:hypothetical protein
MAQKLLIEENPQETVVSFRWFRNSDIFLVIFAIFWNGIILIASSVVILNGQYQVLLFMSLHILVGLGFGWFTLSQVLNKTTVKISRFELHISHKPIPIFWRKTYELNMKEISEIETYEKLHRNKGNTWLTYGIQCKIDGKPKIVRIIQGLSAKEDAEILKEQILARRKSSLFSKE